MTSVLVTGAAGYIGSHMVLALCDREIKTVAVDNLTSGDRRIVDPRAHFFQADAGDRDAMETLIGQHGVDCVIHFAGSVSVPESIAKPLVYFRNNNCSSVALLDACVQMGVRRFIFSSTASVYGIPERIPIHENDPKVPISPYGYSKLATEWLISSVAGAYDLDYVILRYFNVAGADPQLRSGQSTRNATHLVKVVAEILAGKRTGLDVYGTDYETPDGTCQRDYVHVSDLVEAHLLALEHLTSGGSSQVLNCGYGRGVSVLDVLSAANRHFGSEIAFANRPRRAGDPPILVAANDRIREVLGWTPKYDDLDFIISTAASWETQPG